MSAPGSDLGGKYTLTDRCDWCGDSPAKEILIQKNGVKAKRYLVTAMACAKCAARLAPDSD